MTDDWRSDAACQGADPAWFDYVSDDHETPKARLKRFARARAVCASCPVITECVEARTTRDDGIRGGLLWRQGSVVPQPWPLLPGQTSMESVEPGPPAATPYRDLRSRFTGVTPIRLAACGTYAAGRRHERYGEPIDPACRKALNAKEAARVARARAGGAA